MITYKSLNDRNNVQTPVLHKVVYDHRIHESMPAHYQRSHKDHLVDAWLESNCQSPYYHNPGWTQEKFIEFEDGAEAVAFALKWAQ